MEWHKMHQPITISPYGFYVMKKHDEWRIKIAKEKGFLPLHKMKQEYNNATMKFIKEKIKLYGKEVPTTRIEYVDPPEGVRAPTREEWDAYDRAQDEWIAEEILRDWDWAHFVRFCEDNKIKDFISGHYPCDGGDKQCQMNCEYLINGRCPKP